VAAKRRRRRGEGSVFHRKGRGWVAQVAYRDASGVRRFLTRAARSEDAARLALPALLASVGGDAILADPDETLDDFLAEWLARTKGTIAASTLVTYEIHVRKHIAPLLGGIIVTELRASDVDRLVKRLARDGASPAYVERILTTLSMALEQAVREGTLTRNVARLVRRPKVDRTSHIRALTEPEMDEILELVSGDPLEALYALLLGSGMRVGEAVALDWADIDLDRGTVRVRSGKTSRARRTAGLAPFAVTALRSHRARSTIVGPGAPIFRGVQGERLRSDVAYHRWAKLRRDLPAMRLHDLRHGHASLLLAKGTPMRLIADQLGHSNPALTARVYAHVVEEQLLDAVRGLGERRRSG
jgi:integrase